MTRLTLTSPRTRPWTRRPAGLLFAGMLAAAASLTAAAPATAQAASGALGMAALPVGDSTPTLSLQDVMARALENNLDLRMAQEKRAQQDAVIGKAWAAITPQISVNGNYTYNYPEVAVEFQTQDSIDQQALLFDSLGDMVAQSAGFIQDPAEREAALQRSRALKDAANEIRNTDVSPIVVNPAHVFGGNIQVSMPIFNGRALPLLQNAYSAVDMVDVTIKQNTAALMYAITQAYYGATVAQRMQDITKAQFERASRHEDATKARFEAGTQTELAVKRARLETIKAQRQVDVANNTYTQAVSNLGLLINAKTMFDVTTPGKVAAVEHTADLDGLIQRAREQRAELKADQLNLLIAERNRLDAWMMFAPSLNLVGQARYTSNTSGFQSEPWTGAVIVQGSIPIFDGGTAIATLRETASKIKEAELRIQQTKRKVDAQVRGNIADIEQKKAALESAKLSAEIARETHENAQSMFGAGMATDLDVIDANLAVFGADLEQVRAEFDLEQARLGLAYVLGELQPTVKGDAPPSPQKP